MFFDILTCESNQLIGPKMKSYKFCANFTTPALELVQTRKIREVNEDTTASYPSQTASFIHSQILLKEAYFKSRATI